MYKDSSKSLVKGQSSNCLFLCIRPIIPNQMPHQPGSSGLLRVTFNIFEVFKDIFTLQTNSDASNDRNKHIK